jgi:hypothetical protein
MGFPAKLTTPPPPFSLSLSLFAMNMCTHACRHPKCGFSYPVGEGGHPQWICGGMGSQSSPAAPRCVGECPWISPLFSLLVGFLLRCGAECPPVWMYVEFTVQHSHASDHTIQQGGEWHGTECTPTQSPQPHKCPDSQLSRFSTL